MVVVVVKVNDERETKRASEKSGLGTRDDRDNRECGVGPNPRIWS